MAEIIASTYELIRHIGAGGGGNVYLARHVRLDKLVVLKADKRKLNTRPELLRREVDVLKDLTHSYIPKVYDFFVENDTVYTVMDYIEGESLDKPLKRGERFPQKQVVEWARQLLEALVYLHSPTHGDPPRGFVHSDIKPANLMRTPFNTICLIDFNISLALGELNFVGCSAGYASPEHYGLDYSSGLGTSDTARSSSVSGSSKRMVVPDVRSDIYSTGATLYHLMSGRRPESDARNVVPLSDKEFSPQLVRIISRAMEPDPELRYQTAAEMLYDLDHLHENDPRLKRLKCGTAVFEACMGFLFIVSLTAGFIGLKRMQMTESSLKLAEYSRTALSDGDHAAAVSYALDAIPERGGLLIPETPPQVQAALADALGVYDLSDGFRSYLTVELESEALFVELSPEGDTFACIISGKAQVYSTEDAALIVEFPADRSALSQIRYIDNDTVLYAGDGSVRAYSLSSRHELWTGEPATYISVSSDGAYAACVYRDSSYAVLYDTASGREAARVDFRSRKQAVVRNDIFVDPGNMVFQLDNDGSRLAVSFADGSLSVFSFDGSGEMILTSPGSGYDEFSGGFFSDIFAYSAAGSGSSVFSMTDCAKGTVLTDQQTDGKYEVCADENGILVRSGGIIAEIDPYTGAQTPVAQAEQEITGFAWDGTHSIVCTGGNSPILSFWGNSAYLSEVSSSVPMTLTDISNGTAAAASTDSCTVRILKLNEQKGTQVLAYDAYYPHDEARLSADGKTAMLFSVDGFRILDMNGGVITEVGLYDPDGIYDQQFYKDARGSVLEVTYYSGKVLAYSATDGSLISEELKDKPDSSLYEELDTADYRIESDLHGAARVFRRSDETQVAELDEDAFLTYATQLDDGRLVMQYITTDGKYYGVLMSSEFQELARLPYLCDVYNGTAVFDYPDGNLRTTRFYDLAELLSAAGR